MTPKGSLLLQFNPFLKPEQRTHSAKNTPRPHPINGNEITNYPWTDEAIELFGFGEQRSAYFLESNMFLERQAWMSHASFLHGSLLGCAIPSLPSSSCRRCRSTDHFQHGVGWGLGVLAPPRAVRPWSSQSAFETNRNIGAARASNVTPDRPIEVHVGSVGPYFFWACGPVYLLSHSNRHRAIKIWKLIKNGWFKTF